MAHLLVVQILLLLQWHTTIFLASVYQKMDTHYMKPNALVWIWLFSWCVAQVWRVTQQVGEGMLQQWDWPPLWRKLGSPWEDLKLVQTILTSIFFNSPLILISIPQWVGAHYTLQPTSDHKCCYYQPFWTCVCLLSASTRVPVILCSW